MKNAFKYFLGKPQITFGNMIYEAWPTEIVEKFNLSQDFDGGLYINDDNDIHDKFLNDARLIGKELNYFKIPIVNKKNYSNFNFFKFSPVISITKGTPVSPPQEICKNQFFCDFEPINNKWGCARVLKPQTSLITINPDTIFPKKDIFPVDIEFLTSTYENYFITKKMMQIFIDEKVTGVEFYPLINSHTSRDKENIRLSVGLGEKIRDDIFQMKITGLSNDFPIDEMIENKKCSICSGFRDYPVIWPPNHIPDRVLQDFDLQLIRNFSSSKNGTFSTISPTAIASKKIISIFVKHKVSGFLKNSHTNWYEAILTES